LLGLSLCFTVEEVGNHAFVVGTLVVIVLRVLLDVEVVVLVRVRRVLLGCRLIYSSLVILTAGVLHPNVQLAPFGNLDGGDVKLFELELVIVIVIVFIRVFDVISTTLMLVFVLLARFSINDPRNHVSGTVIAVVHTHSPATQPNSGPRHKAYRPRLHVVLADVLSCVNAFMTFHSEPTKNG